MYIYIIKIYNNKKAIIQHNHFPLNKLKKQQQKKQQQKPRKHTQKLPPKN